MRGQDLTGKVFGKLTVIEPNGVRSDRCTLWLCRCECGNEITTASRNLTGDHTKSCGCIRIMELEGQRFGKLVVIERAGKRCDSIDWKCLCDCGNTHYVITKCLMSGQVRSCGCLHAESTRKHDKSRAVSGTPEYRAYHGAKRRCQSPNDKDYAEYGGRGIKFLFKDFQEFYECLGPRPKGKTNDRIDYDGNYESGNCRWATWQEQANNRRNACSALTQKLAEANKKIKELQILVDNSNTVAV